jgi:uncharacterized repeat protein (TIGR02543 family)
MKLRRILGLGLSAIMAFSSVNVSFAEDVVETDERVYDDTAVEINEPLDTVDEITSSEAIFDNVNLKPYSKSDTDFAYAVDGGYIYFDESTGTITDADESITSANIPSTINNISVTSIGDNAFDSCSSLTSITIPDGITSIGYAAFYGCSSLTDVAIPGGVTSIAGYTFLECSSLINVQIPNSVTSIGNNAFEDCSSLGNIIIPNSVTVIGNYAFARCENLSNITLPESVTSIGNYAFSGCENLTNITLPESVTGSLYGTFSGCSSLTDIVIPSGITEIGYHTFYGCKNLSSINIPDSVKSIGGRAFYNCSSLTEITIPSSVESFGSPEFVSSGNIFESCENLERVVISANVQSLCEGMFYSCTNLSSVVLPDSLTTIDDKAFYGCSALKEINIPSGVTGIGTSSFCSCKSLVNIDLPYGLVSIGSNAFGYCESLYNVKIPDTVTDLADDAFYGCEKWNGVDYAVENGNIYFDESTGTIVSCDKSITNADIPSKINGIDVVAIADNVFENCYYLKRVTLPDGLKTIGYKAFFCCSSLVSLDIPDSVTEIGEIAFAHCYKLRSAKLSNNIKVIPMYSFYDCSSLENVQLPSALEEIDMYAFEDCDALNTIVIPQSVTTIDERAFYNWKPIYDDFTVYCYAGSVADNSDLYTGGYNVILKYLDTETAPEFSFVNVNEVAYPVDGGNLYFNPDTGEITGCDENVTKVEIPSEINGIPVTSLGLCAFRYNYNLTEVKLPSSVTEIKAYALSQCYGLKRIEMKPGVKTIGDWAFYDDTVLEYINIPNTVETIGRGAFQYVAFNSSCNEIIIPDSVKSIGEAAFYYSAFRNIIILGVDTALDLYNGGLHFKMITCRKNSIAEQYCKENDVTYAITIIDENSVGTDGSAFELPISKIYSVGTQASLTNGLIAKLTPHTGDKSDIVWASSNTEVVEITPETGIDSTSFDSLWCDLNCKAAGTSVITVSNSSGASASCVVTVTEGEVTQLKDAYGITGKSTSATAETKEEQLRNAIDEYNTALYVYEQRLASAMQNKQVSEDTEVNALNAAIDYFTKQVGINKYIKSRYTRIIDKYATQLNSIGLGEVVTFVSDCKEICEKTDKISKVDLGDYSSVYNEIKALSQLDIDETSKISTTITNEAYSNLKSCRVKLIKAAENYIYDTPEQSVWDKITSWEGSVDIIVYDNNGNEIGSIIGDEVVSSSDSLVLKKTGDLKQAYTSNGIEVSYKIVATDSGLLNITVEDYSDGNVVGRQNFYNIPLDLGSEFTTSTISDKIENMTIYSSDGERIDDEYLVASQDACVNVEIVSSDNGTVTNSGEYAKGDGVILIAIPNDGYTFSGWYNGDELLSTNIIYNFTAVEDASLTAKFSEELLEDIPQPEDFLYGDADNDGILTASDAAYVLQRVLNSNSELPIANATENWMRYTDVDADNILTASDAAYILQKVLNGNSEFPIEATNQTA